MRSRSLFARRDAFAALRPITRRYRDYRVQAQRSILGPLALAVAVALAGNWLAANTSPASTRTITAASTSAVALQPKRFDVRDAEIVGSTRPAVAKPAKPAKRVARTTQRASRSTRRPAVAPARWRRPSRGPVTSPYGMRWGRMHRGLDFGAPNGSPVFAAFDGVVVSAGFDGGYGRRLIIRHRGGISTTYNHLSAFAITGGRVRAGQLVGRVGTSGSSTGPHLHFEVMMGGAHVDPRSFLRKRGVWV